MATQTQLREAVKAAVQAQLALPASTVWESRYTPRIDSKDLENVHIVFMILDVSTEIIARDVDTDSYTIGIVVQQHVAGEDDVAKFDDLTEIVELIKSLWRGEGALRHVPIANCTFKELVHSMPFEPLHMVNYGVFTSVIEVSFRAEEIEE